VATVVPFTGMRPRQELADKVAAPPYDVVSSEKARALADGNPLSFLHISKPEIDLDPSVDVYSDAVYDRARANMDRSLAEGIFTPDPLPCFYCYRQTLGDHCQTGIVALVSANEYENGTIKKHELTRPAKENDRTRHMAAVRAQVGPVFLTYRADATLKDRVSRSTAGTPVNDFVVEGVRHQLWIMDDTSVLESVTNLFAAVPVLFVADGHHRSAAAVRYRAQCRDANPGHTGTEPYNYFMAVLFPHDELTLLGYHRVIRDLGAYDVPGFLVALGEVFHITPSQAPVTPMRPQVFGLYLAGHWYALALKDQYQPATDVVSSLDVAILQDHVLTPLLAIRDPRTDDRIDFIGGARGLAALAEAVDNGGYAAAFACHPVTIEQLIAIAEEDRLMPPKSTWFEPKLKSGLVMHWLG